MRGVSHESADFRNAKLTVLYERFFSFFIQNWWLFWPRSSAVRDLWPLPNPPCLPWEPQRLLSRSQTCAPEPLAISPVSQPTLHSWSSSSAHTAHTFFMSHRNWPGLRKIMPTNLSRSWESLPTTLSSTRRMLQNRQPSLQIHTTSTFQSSTTPPRPLPKPIRQLAPQTFFYSTQHAASFTEGKSTALAHAAAPIAPESES